MSWLVLNYINPTPADSPQKAIDRFRLINPDADIELFAPKFIQIVRHQGQLIKKESPLTFHYIFLRASYQDALSLCAMHNGFSLILDHAGSDRYLSVSDTNMESFRQIARVYGNNLPCYPLADLQLEEGDLVEVVTGDFPGLQGTYIPRRGGRTGNIYIAVSQNLATVAYDVRADYIRVLKFAPTTRRPYDIIDAFIPRLEKAVSFDRNGLSIPPDLLSHLIIFSRRMGSVKIDSPKIEAKLQALLWSANTLLGRHDEAEKNRERFQKLLPNLTNPVTLSRLHPLLPHQIESRI